MSETTQAANTVTLYKITVTKACAKSKKGTYFSLEPWIGDNRMYEARDDGGETYVLPPGFHVERSVCGAMEIYSEQDIRHIVGNQRGKPCLVSPIGTVSAPLKMKT